MAKEISEMIYELVRLVEQELGTKLHPESAFRLESALCKQFGGESVYVPKLPKLVKQVRLAAIGTGIATAELAREMGISRQHVWRIMRKVK
jgi:Mor family transcriptional regulator